MILFQMQVVLCSEKFRISRYGLILDDPEVLKCFIVVWYLVSDWESPWIIGVFLILFFIIGGPFMRYLFYYLCSQVTDTWMESEFIGHHIKWSYEFTFHSSGNSKNMFDSEADMVRWSDFDETSREWFLHECGGNFKYFKHLATYRPF